MKQKCPICSKTKGKRLCKIKEKTLICPQCCAHIRNPDCADCSHYTQAKKYGFEKMKKASFREFTAKIDPAIDKAVDDALAFVDDDNIEKAKKLLTELMEKHPDVYIVQYGMGTVLAMEENFAESLTYFDRCLELFPYFVEGWFNKGAAHKHLLDMDATKKSFRKVVEYGNRDDPNVITADKYLRNNLP